MKLVLVIAIYKRHDLTKIVLDYYRALCKKHKNIEIVIAGSEGEISRDLAQGFHYIETANSPLTYKNNAMLEKAKELNPDAVVLLGSDDLICTNVIKWYFDLIKQGTDKVWGFKDIYFYSTEHKTLGYLPLDKHFGAGRFFPKSVLEKCEYKGWGKKLDRGCDYENETYLKRLGVEFESINIENINGFLIDIKHDYNISSKNIIFACTPINPNIMAKKIGKPTADKIENLVFTPKAVQGNTVKIKCNDVNESLKGRVMVVSKIKADLLISKGWAELCE